MDEEDEPDENQPLLSVQEYVKYINIIYYFNYLLFNILFY